MAVYVCSDIHGMFDRYENLLKEINLSELDELYILGDVIDRNPNGIEILLDIRKRSNVHLMLGNHELFLLDSIVDNCSNGVSINKYWCDVWLSHNNGGSITLDKFCKLSFNDRESILAMLKECLLIKVVVVDGKSYHLSHSSTINGFIDGELFFKNVDHEQVSDVVWKSIFRHGSYHDGSDKYNEHLTYVSGHVPVQRLGYTKMLNIRNIINIDCGCAFGHGYGYLGCLRLNDLKEFYID